MANIYDMSDTWNDGLTTFNAIKMNVTDTASAADSLLMDLQVGGVSKFSVDKDGKITIPYAGTSSSPALTFGDVDTGFYSSVSGRVLHYASDGTVIFSVDGNGFSCGTSRVSRSSPSSPNVPIFIPYAADSDTGIGRGGDNSISIVSGGNYSVLSVDANHVLAQRNGANPQAFNLYNTYTDATIYERGFMRWNADAFEIGMEAAGGGSLRNVKIVGPGGPSQHYISLDAIGGYNIKLNAGTGRSVSLAYVGSNGVSLNSTGFHTNDSNIPLGKASSRWNNTYFTGVIDHAPTWNDALTTFTGIKMNVTDTASDAASLLMDLQVGGTSKFSVDKTGGIFIQRPIYNASWIDVYVNNNFSTPTMRIGFNSKRIVGRLEFCQTTAGSVGDLILDRDAANTLAQRNGANPQAFNLYNTYTDASNYERGFMRWNSNTLIIGTDRAGTGANRNISIVPFGTLRLGAVGGDRLSLGTSSFIPLTDGGVSLGLFNYRFSDFYLSGNYVHTPTWNDANTVFAGMSMNVTDTASDAASLLMDLQVGGTSKFSVDKLGNFESNGFSAQGNDLICTFSSADVFNGGSSAFTFTPDIFRIGSTAYFGISSGAANVFQADVRLYRDASNTLAQRNDANPQKFNIYQTYTDENNYVRGSIYWVSDDLYIDRNVAGTGAAQGSVNIKSGGASLALNEAGAYDSSVLSATSFVDILSGPPSNSFIIRSWGSFGLTPIRNPSTSPSHLGGGSNRTKVYSWSSLCMKEEDLSSNNPGEDGVAVFYISNGATEGSAGDIVYKRSANSVISTDYIPLTSGNSGGSGSAGAGNQYIEIEVNGVVYKVLHDGTV